MIGAVLSGFALASIAPLLHRVGGSRTGAMLALLPLGLLIYFASYAREVQRGDVIIIEHQWISSLDIPLAFRLDGISWLFALLISAVGVVIFIYAGAYLKGQPNQGRFYAYLLSFMAAMLGTVLSENLIILFMFWELTAFTSYLLIGFQHERTEARWAAFQALLVTAIGGVMMLFGFLLLGSIGGHMDLSTLHAQADRIQASPLYVPIVALILMGAFTKSAHVPFHFWLPGAMEAPTPVSAYLHAATMVKAGSYLLARLTPVLGGTEIWLYALSIAGALTMLTGAWMAVLQQDLKRILAYSTISVLGMVTMLLGIGTSSAIKAAFVILVGHGLYKAALFLVAGAIDHSTGTRNTAQLGGLRRFMPITALASALAACSSAGLPPFFGFIGKELLYATGWAFSPGAVLLTAAMGVASVLLFIVAWVAGMQPFVGTEKPTPKSPHEAPWGLWLGPLALGSVGLIWGIFPGQVEHLLIRPAFGVLAGQTFGQELALWHGWHPILVLSMMTVAAGIGGVLFRPTVLRLVSSVHTSRFVQWGPTYGFKQGFAALLAIARWQTSILQSGYQRYYLITIFTTLIVLEGYVLIRWGHVPRPDGVTAYLYEFGIGLFILLAAMGAIFAKTILAAVASMGVVGYGVMLIYVMYGAPDLAITQILIETLTVILFVLVVYRLPRFVELSGPWGRMRDAIVALAVGGLITVLVLEAGQGAEGHSAAARYFAEHSVLLAHGRNIVNVILVDFRGLDTLGEITVLSISAIGVYALLQLKLLRGGKR